MMAAATSALGFLFTNLLLVVARRCGGADAAYTTMFASNGALVIQDVVYNWDLDVLVFPVFKTYVVNAVSYIMSIPYSGTVRPTVLAGNESTSGGHFDAATGLDALFDAPTGVALIFGAIGAALNPMLSVTGNNTPYGYLVSDNRNYCGDGHARHILASRLLHAFRTSGRRRLERAVWTGEQCPR